MNIINSVFDWIKHQDPDMVKAWGPVLIGLGTVAVSLIALAFSLVVNFLLLFFQRKQNKHQNDYNLRQLALTKSKEEREDILKRLNGFYGPFMQLRTESNLLYGKFEYELDRKHLAMNKRFRTLRYILEDGTFTNQEEALLKEILKINQKLVDLIESSSGVVDKLELQDLLGKFGSHTRVLQMSYDKELEGPAELFEDIVFPLAIDGAVENAIRRLKDHIRELDTVIEGRRELKSPKTSNATIKYYDKHADTYANKTQFLDLSELYDQFRRFVPRSGRILDAGCGVGRDTRYFIEHGYRVVSFDASREMTQKCNSYPHAYCLYKSFEEIQFREEFDGVWCCGSLIHLETEKAVEAVKLLTTSLKGGGILFLSLKAGTGNKKSDGRFFQYYDETTITKLYGNDLRLEPHKTWRNKPLGPTDSEQREWLNILLKKKIGLF